MREREMVVEVDEEEGVEVVDVEEVVTWEAEEVVVEEVLGEEEVVDVTVEEVVAEEADLPLEEQKEVLQSFLVPR